MSEQTKPSQDNTKSGTTIPGQPSGTKPSEAWLKVTKRWGAAGGESLEALRASLSK